MSQCHDIYLMKEGEVRVSMALRGTQRAAELERRAREDVPAGGAVGLDGWDTAAATPAVQRRRQNRSSSGARVAAAAASAAAVTSDVMFAEEEGASGRMYVALTGVRNCVRP